MGLPSHIVHVQYRLLGKDDLYSSQGGDSVTNVPEKPVYVKSDEGYRLLGHWSSIEQIVDDPENANPVVKSKPIVRVYQKIGRNAKCTCGSGKKFKKCCIGIFPSEYMNLATDGLRRE